MKATAMISELKNHKCQVVLLYGPEEALLDEMQSQILSLLEPAYADLNLSVADEREEKIDLFLEDLYTLPFLDAFRIGLVRTDSLFKDKSKLWNEKRVEKLLALAAAPPPGLILLLRTSMVDKRTKLYKTLEKHALIWEGSRLNQAQVSQRIDQRLQAAGVEIDRSVKEYLIERSGYHDKEAGSSLSSLESEIDKLISLQQAGVLIDKAAVGQLMQDTSSSNVFALCDQLLERHSQKALHTLCQMIEKGEAPQMILSVLSSQMSLLCRLHLLKSRGYNASAAAAELKLNPWRAKKLYEKLPRVSYRQALGYVDKALDLDYRIKTGRIAPLDAVLVLCAHMGQQPIKERLS